MPEHPEVSGRPCAVAATLELVGDRWSLLAVREIHFGNHRFSQIARNTGAPRDRLAARLKSLVASGVLERREYQATRFEYCLTEAGKELFPVLATLLAWGERWAVDEPPMLLEHHGHRVEPRAICGVCGEPMHERNLQWTSNAAGWSMTGPNSQSGHNEPAQSAGK
jgi:DNA-binding HxlR family transcriptional regulator